MYILRPVSHGRKVIASFAAISVLLFVVPADQVSAQTPPEMRSPDVDKPMELPEPAPPAVRVVDVSLLPVPPPAAAVTETAEPEKQKAGDVWERPETVNVLLAEPEPADLPLWCEKYGHGCRAIWRQTERWRGLVSSYANDCPETFSRQEGSMCWHGGATVDMVLAVIFCESHGEEDARNSGNDDTGLFQFIPSTWRNALGRIEDESWRKSEMWKQPYVVEQWMQAGFNSEILESEHPEGDWRKDGPASIWMAFWLTGTETDRNAGWNHWVCWKNVQKRFSS